MLNRESRYNLKIQYLLQISNVLQNTNIFIICSSKGFLSFQKSLNSIYATACTVNTLFDACKYVCV